MPSACSPPCRLTGYSKKPKLWLVEKLSEDYKSQAEKGATPLTYLRWHERKSLGSKLGEGFTPGEDELQPEGDDDPKVSGARRPAPSPALMFAPGGSSLIRLSAKAAASTTGSQAALSKNV